MRLRLLFLFLLPVALFAQSVRWEPADESGSSLQLIFENCNPTADPVLPSINGVTFTFAGRSEQNSIINFTRTSSVVLGYTVRSRQGGKVSIPAFSVPTDKGAQTVPAYESQVSQPAIDSFIRSTLKPSVNDVWAGQVFPIEYRLALLRRNYAQISPQIDWPAAPLVAEDWGKLELAEATSNNESIVLGTSTTRAIAKSPGTLQLKPATQIADVVTGLSSFGFFQQQRVERVTVTSNESALTVRPLPANAPAGFKGAVGEFKLEAKVVPQNAAVGEPVTWTLELSGTGNWPDITGLPARAISKDFQVIQPKPKRTNPEGKLFDGTLTEDAVLMPTKAGPYTLESVSFDYFDPVSGTYKTLTTPRTIVTITAPVQNKFAIATEEPKAATPPAPTAQETQAAAQAKLDRLDTKIAIAPSGLPRDPLPAGPLARVPFAQVSTFAWWAVAPFLALLPFWFWLGVRRARTTDPLLVRRQAYTQLLATLTQLRSASDDQRGALLLAWQHQTALIWPLVNAAPAATSFEDPAWRTLWSEADRVIYGPRASLPADWIDRAHTALAGKKLPTFSPLQAFLPRNLLPFLAVIVLLGAALPLQAASDASTASAAETYGKGEFATAEKLWRQALEQNPTDWSARHNLSLALSQQSRAPEAAAHAAVAFVQQPRDAAVQWNFLFACDKAGYVPTPLATFVRSGPQASLARLTSPGRWELIVIIGAGLAAVSLGALLWLAYTPRRQSAWRRWLATGVLGLSLITVLAALTGRAAFGETNRKNAAIVWHPATLRSIPSEADVEQKTTPVAAGAVGLMDKTFLGWVRLSFANGQTGWLRKEDLVTFWGNEGQR